MKTSGTLAEIKDLPKNICGVYGLAWHGEMEYVGQSSDIHARILQHFQLSTLKKSIQLQKERPSYAHDKAVIRYKFFHNHKDEMRWMILKVCNREQLNRWEQEYIRIYQPVFNYAGVNGEYVPTRGRGQSIKHCAAPWE